jgi:hypothetical protein
MIIALDVSTKCVGIALFDLEGTLLELTHISPKVKPLPEEKSTELFEKANIVVNYLTKYKDDGLNITNIVIEEPLLNSLNVYTVATLLKFNGMVSKMLYDMFKVTPSYISSYDARKYAFPKLTQPNAKGKLVLFGGYPKDIDKKRVVWEMVNEKLGGNTAHWIYDKKGVLKKENFDMSDAATLGYAYFNMEKE